MILREGVISPQEFLDEFTDIKQTSVYTTEQLRHTLDGHNYETLWDFPLSEIDEAKGDVVLVTDGFDFRWFETEI